MIRQGHLIAVLVTFLIGCAVLLLVVGCAGTRSETSKKEQGSSPQATDSEEARCEGTRTIKVTTIHEFPDAAPTKQSVVFTTNDLPDCPNKGGLLSGTDERDKLNGLHGDDEIRGLGDSDMLYGGSGNDVIYCGPGDDRAVYAGKGDDILHCGPGDDRAMFADKGADVYYGGDGNDVLGGSRDKGEGEDVYYGEGGNDLIFARGDRQPDKLYCGKGKDRYVAEKIDYVDSSCEKKMLAAVT